MRPALRLPSPCLLGVAVGLCLLLHASADPVPNHPYEVSRMSGPQIEDALQQCPLVQDLNRHKSSSHPPTSSLTSTIFSYLFPGGPAVNALLATLYISGPPNFLLTLCPPNIDPSSLSVMVAFAVGGLLGDTIFHLLPEIYLGEASPDHARFVLVNPNRNLLLGVAILVGFVTFVAMDKTLRIATGGTGGHDHSYATTNGSPRGAEKTAASPAKSSSVSRSPNDKARARRSPKKHRNVDLCSKCRDDGELLCCDGCTRAYHFDCLDPPIDPFHPPEGDWFCPVCHSKKNSNKSSSNKDASTSIRLSAYLNLIADFTHNITDGLALSSSFYASPALGATTTVAVFFHEIPHEVGDFALLIQSGFTKQKAMYAQFVTALGALLGTLLGITIQELGKRSSASTSGNGPLSLGLLDTGLGFGDLLLPFTAGTFLYVGTVAVIPELLETGPNKEEETRKTLTQFAAMAAGAGIMLAISWA